MSDAVAVWRDLALVRERNPLVLNITNNVVTNTTANALLALGASPAMTHAPEDAGELATLADALVLNIGTPAAMYADSMLQAGRSANGKGIPVVLDPVAAGATAYRRELVRTILGELKIAVIRGNASEILYLAGENAVSKGADSVHGSDEAAGGAAALAKRLGCVVCVSGARDIVTDGRRSMAVSGGHPMMTKVTGLGCTATAVVGAFAAVGRDHFTATAHAMAVMGMAGEMAAEVSAGPGTLQVRFYDFLYSLAEADVTARTRLETL